MLSFLTLVYILPYLFSLSFTNASPVLSSNITHNVNCPKGKERVFDLTISKGFFAPDGFGRDMFHINGTFPGPLISCNKGDILVLNVKNVLNETTTIHSHGILQRGTPWYDGVPGATQCRIPPGQTFTYKFQVCQSGTYWYHSHDKAQYIEGVVGALVIHDPEDPYINDYDEEIVVLLQDWYHTDSRILIKQFLTPESQGNEPSPDNGLINGKNSFNCSSASPDSRCNKVIEVEGMITKRHKVQRLPINIGQRYSVIVNANKPIDSYWMRAEMETSCFAVVSPTLNPIVKAIVKYEGCKSQTPSSSAWSDIVQNCTDLNPNQLQSYHPQQIPEADEQIKLIVTFRPDENNVTLAFINNSTYVINTKHPVLNKIYDGETDFAPSQNVFLINQTKVIEIILINKDAGEHPFHLHGHVFWIHTGKNGTRPDFTTFKNNKHLIQRDTTTVPANGWAVLRFVSNNPGVWGFHCHIEWHVQSGLVAQFVTQPDKIRQLNPPDDWKGL
ncbi:7047_t:CDS:2, partial [Racocetra persica]